MAPKLHGVYASTCTGRALTALFEKGVEDVEVVPVNMQHGEHKQPDFLKLQPFGQIPVYEDEDVGPLFESRAIARYVSHKYAEQGTPLYGHSIKDKALTEQWLEVEAQNYNPAISTIVFQLLFTVWFGGKTDEKVVEENLVKLEKVLDVYEEHLSKHKYLAGDFFSLADLSHIPYTHYLVNVAKKAEPITSRKHVNAWWEDISSRPSWKKVLELAAANQ